VARLDAETTAVVAENHALNKAQRGLSEEVKALKSRSNALTDQASALRYNLSKARGATEGLRAAIVQSPGKVQAQLDDVNLAGAWAGAVWGGGGGVPLPATHARTHTRTHTHTDTQRNVLLISTQARGHSPLQPPHPHPPSPTPRTPHTPHTPPAVEKERAALAESERHSRDTAARLDTVGRVEREVQRAISLMARAEGEIGRKKEVSRKVGRAGGVF
jgi:hypothetical protein